MATTVLGNTGALSNDHFTLGEKIFEWGTQEAGVLQAFDCATKAECLNSIKELMGVPVKSISVMSPYRNAAPIDKIYTVLDDDKSTKSIDRHIPALRQSLGKPTELFEMPKVQPISVDSKNKLIATLKKITKDLLTSKKHYAAVWRLGDVNVFLRSIPWAEEKNIIIEYANPRKMLGMLDGPLERTNSHYRQLANDITSKKIFVRKNPIWKPTLSYVEEKGKTQIHNEDYQQATLLLSENYYFATPSPIAEELDANHFMLWRSRNSDDTVISNRLVSFAFSIANIQVSCDKNYPARGPGRMQLSFKSKNSTSLKGKICDAYNADGLVQLHQHLEELLGDSIVCSEQEDS